MCPLQPTFGEPPLTESNVRANDLNGNAPPAHTTREWLGVDDTPPQLGPEAARRGHLASMKLDTEEICKKKANANLPTFCFWKSLVIIHTNIISVNS